MPITPDEAIPVAELLCQLRPRWNVRGVMTSGLRPLEKHPAPLEVIVWAAIRAARNPEVVTPAVIPLNGPHWNLGDRPQPPRLTPDLECPAHIGQWAATCSLCAADKLGTPDQDDTDPPDHPWAGPEPLSGRELFLRERERLNRAAVVEADPVSTDVDEVTP